MGEDQIPDAIGVYVGSAQPGDSEAEAKTRQYLQYHMRSNPTAAAGKSKPEFRVECCQKFGVPARSFNRIWGQCVATTGAAVFKKAGRKRRAR